MKTIKSICAAMVCCALAAGFSSCSKDDDGPNGPAVKMQLEGITITEGSSTATLSNFVYDNQGRLTSYDVNDNGDKETVTYTYNSSYIERAGSDGNNHTHTFNLENGVITSTSCGDTFEYSNGNMVRWTETSRCYISYSWENGNPIRETVHYDAATVSGETDVTSFGYSELPCYIGNFQTLFDEYASIHVELMGGSCWDPFLQQQGYFGNLPKNLVTSAKAPRNEWQLSYEVNVNGYPTKITGKDENGTAVMTLTWR